MKKLQLLALSLLVCVFTLNAQDISFSFTANHTCEYAPLDSVLVENLTQGGDTVLYWNDTVLNLVLTGVEMQTAMENDFHVSQNYPNPFSSQTKIDVFVPEQDDFTINVYDVTGRRVTTYENSLEKGMHNFTFNAGNSSNYILTVNSTKYVQKILMIRVGADDNPAENLTYNGIIPEEKSMLKSTRSYFAYELGDELKFTGFVDGDFEDINDTPSSDEDYVFDINNTVPEQPGAITGITAVCEEATGENYSISAVEGATTYTWTVPSGANITGGQGTTSITVDFGTSSGDVCVTADNACGAGTASCETITVSDPVVTISGDTEICDGESTTLTAGGGTSYEWSTGSTSASIDVSDADTYTVTVTDENGCTGIDDVTVTVNSNPTADAGSDETICSGGSVEIGGSPTASGGSGSGYSFAWSPSTGLSSTSVANPTANPGSTETYTVTVTDGTGCTATDVVTVTVEDNPIVNAGDDETICSGGSVEIGGSPTASGGSGSGYSFAWSPATGLSSTSVSNPTANPGSTETYTVTVTDGSGCTASDVVTVTVGDSPVVNAGDDEAICEGGSVEIGGSPTASGGSGSGYTYSWGPSTGLSSTTVANPTASPASSEDYVVTVIDGNGCSGADYITVTVNSNPTADAGTDEMITEGGSVEIGGAPTASGGTSPYAYEWSPSTGLSSTTVANPEASPLSTETYALTLTDDNGCTAADNVTVTVTEGPIADAGTDQTICVGGSIEIGGSPTASGGTSPYAYEWSPSTGLSSTTDANPTASPASTETYIVTVTDDNNYTDSDTVTVTVSEPNASISYNDPVCVGGDLDLEGLPSGMASYNWEGPDGFATTGENPSIVDVTTAASGLYHLTVTDSYGCSDATSTNITINDNPTADAGTEATICIGESVEIGGSPTASDGSGGGYSYEWSPASGLSSTADANPDATPDTTATYTVTVTDGNGCTAMDTVQITVNDPNAQATSNSPVCGNDQIELYGNPGGMVSYEWTGPAWFTWQQPKIGQNQTITNAGTGDEGWYELTVEDDNGCISTSSVYVTVITGDPDAPAEASHTVGPDSIEWHWNAVATASGYKYNTTDDYGSATDIGTDTSFLQTGLTCGTPYSLYVWAYDDCGG
ncbi:MAG: PKD domain-containing protein, partial [Bacteroidota bacterium]